MNLDWQTLDAEFDPGIAVAKGKEGETFYIEINSPSGRAANRLWMHPRIARKLRDWLNKHYQDKDLLRESGTI